MTKKEALKSIIQVYVDDNTLELSLLGAGLNGADEATSEDLSILEIAAVPVLQSLMVVSSEGEGDQSTSYNLNGIKTRLLFLAEKHGMFDIVNLVNPKPKVRVRKMY